MSRKRLVFDVGMRWGEDTAWYLRRGFRVVGVEANPALVPGLHERFRDDVARGDLVIVAKAVAPTEGVLQFAVTPGQEQWGTLDDRFVDRYERIAERKVEHVDVETVRFASLLREHGVPYFLKVDIEGFDHLCIEGLAEVDERPSFLSVESCVTSPGATFSSARAEVEQLVGLGYTRFAYVEQRSNAERDGELVTGEGDPIAYTYERGASGPFGRDLGRPWHARAAAGRVAARHVARYRFFGYGQKATFRARVARKIVRTVGPATAGRSLWYDVHAAHASVADAVSAR